MALEIEGLDIDPELLTRYSFWQVWRREGGIG